jgi:methyl-accepting chemotaxis protein
MRHLNITAKIWLSVGVFVAGFVLSTVLGQLESLNTEHTLNTASDALFPAAQQSQEAEAAFQRAVKGFGDAVIMQDASGLDRAAGEGEAAVASLKKLAAIKGLPESRERSAKELLGAVDQFTADARKGYAGILSGGMSTDAQDAMKSLATRTDSLKSSLQGLKIGLAGDLRKQLGNSRSASVSQRLISLAVFFVTFIVAGFIVHLTIRRSITRPILHVIEGMQAAADGAASASDQMASAGDAVAREAQQQAAYIEETSASLEEISATTKQNATRAHEADGLMRTAAATASRAAGAMTDLAGSMKDIADSSHMVSDVLKSIDEIAFHTNILALNAAVEAARAGEAGAGFSVVADEVRALARRAADASKRSEDIIQKTLKDVEHGVNLLGAAQAAFDEVSSGIRSSSVVVTGIASASQEQATGVSQVSSSIVRISKGTQSNAANAHRTAESIVQMKEQVEATRHHLENLVSVVGLRNA